MGLARSGIAGGAASRAAILVGDPGGSGHLDTAPCCEDDKYNDWSDRRIVVEASLGLRMISFVQSQFGAWR